MGASHHFDPTVLREYDIRGIVGETIGEDDARRPPMAGGATRE